MLYVPALVDYKHTNDESIQEIEAILKSVQVLCNSLFTRQTTYIHTVEQERPSLPSSSSYI